MVAGCTANVVAKPDTPNIIINTPVGEGVWVKNGELIKDHPVFYKDGDKLKAGKADIIVGAPILLNQQNLRK